MCLNVFESFENLLRMNSLVNYGSDEEDSSSNPNESIVPHKDSLDNNTALKLLDPKIQESRKQLEKLISPPVPLSESLSLLPLLITDESLVDSTQKQRIQHFYTLRKEKGLSFLPQLEQSHAFRNPSIMQKMIEYMNLNEYGHGFFSSSESSLQDFQTFNSPITNTRKKDFVEFISSKK